VLLQFRPGALAELTGALGFTVRREERACERRCRLRSGAGIGFRLNRNALFEMGQRRIQLAQRELGAADARQRVSAELQRRRVRVG